MQCPYCDNPECEQTSGPDAEGQTEYHCPECGEYFVASQNAAPDVASCALCGTVGPVQQLNVCKLCLEF